jgi:hypothetical protein
VIGQLPPDFFRQFFAILDASPSRTLDLEAKINNLCQRQWLKAQMDVLPAMEQDTFGKVLIQDGVSVATLNEFLEQRLNQDQRLELWRQAQLKIWSEILKVVEQVATAQQRRDIKHLIDTYRG